jgi:hypothetical protein
MKSTKTKKTKSGEHGSDPNCSPSTRQETTGTPSPHAARLAGDLAMEDPWVLSYWLSEQPPVHYCSEAHLPFLVSRLPAGTPPVCHLVQPMWHLDPAYALELRNWLTATRSDDRLIFLLNDEAGVPACRALGLEAWFIHQNAFLDETVWRTPERIIPADYDAVYNARMVPFKRHQLATSIPRLALICPAFDADAKAWERKMSQELPRAARFAHEGNQLSAEQVRAVLWRARVGLCLSAEEGGVYVAGEYALCGLPIVSTPSRGGRDVFVNLPGNMVVPPDPACIAAAVGEIMAQPQDPTLVRLAALRVICSHRQRFIALGQSIYESAGCGRDFSRDFYLRFTNKWGGFRQWSRTVAAEFAWKRHQISPP